MCQKLFKHKYTVKINSPWNFQPSPPLERHQQINKRWTGSHECTLQHTVAKKRQCTSHPNQSSTIYHIALAGQQVSKLTIFASLPIPPVVAKTRGINQPLEQDHHIPSSSPTHGTDRWLGQLNCNNWVCLGEKP